MSSSSADSYGHHIRNRFNSEQPNPSVGTTFEYGWYLISRRCAQDVEEGIIMLRRCMEYDLALYRESMYSIALGYSFLKRYDDARYCTTTLLREYPNDMEAIKLHAELKEMRDREAIAASSCIAVCTATTFGLLLASWIHALVTKDR
ncbi:mitochondrial fission protein TPR repeat-like [Schizosaccharomyces osmophilus]|uniref:Mitochondrial fission 1 protein n=1 Tax=Schizosaccharomyces osmophilus TaxID=2545709 RepID=A0AAE9W992_9SCHI|nr:mitochondrial fission protein TPR repeat-like [Schizosaccharomyces osmophilus]WBW72097.1 mitochondrial fission protein TPR repeat-like [Schizosaccharomyces osmophilus]